MSEGILIAGSFVFMFMGILSFVAGVKDPNIPNKIQTWAFLILSNMYSIALMTNY